MSVDAIAPHCPICLIDRELDQIIFHPGQHAMACRVDQCWERFLDMSARMNQGVRCSVCREVIALNAEDQGTFARSREYYERQRNTREFPEDRMLREAEELQAESIRVRPRSNEARAELERTMQRAAHVSRMPTQYLWNPYPTLIYGTVLARTFFTLGMSVHSVMIASAVVGVVGLVFSFLNLYQLIYLDTVAVTVFGNSESGAKCRLLAERVSLKKTYDSQMMSDIASIVFGAVAPLFGPALLASSAALPVTVAIISSLGVRLLGARLVR